MRRSPAASVLSSYPAGPIHEDGVFEAPKVIVIPGALWEEQQALSELGIRVPEGWEISREVLLKKGVPSSAIIVPKGRAEGTLEELKLAFNTIGRSNKQVGVKRRRRCSWDGFIR